MKLELNYARAAVYSVAILAVAALCYLTHRPAEQVIPIFVSLSAALAALLGFLPPPEAEAPVPARTLGASPLPPPIPREEEPTK